MSDTYRDDETQFGRPTTYCEQAAAIVCERIASGHSLYSICEPKDKDGNRIERDKGVPGYTTVRQWLSGHENFALQYARARQDMAHNHAERITQLAEDALAKRIEPHAARIALDAYKWTASKLLPKVYGDKVALTGPDGGPLEVHHIGQAERQARIAELESKRGPLIEGTAKVV